MARARPFTGNSATDAAGLDQLMVSGGFGPEILHRRRQRKMFGPRLPFAGGQILLDCVARRDAPGMAAVQDGQGAAEHLIHRQPETTMQGAISCSLGCHFRVPPLASLRRGRQVVGYAAKNARSPPRTIPARRRPCAHRPHRSFMPETENGAPIVTQTGMRGGPGRQLRLA